MADLNRAGVIKFTHILYRHDARSPAHQPVGRTGPLTQGGERPVTRRRCDGVDCVAPRFTYSVALDSGAETAASSAEHRNGCCPSRPSWRDDPSRRSGADFSVRESCGYRPEQPMNVPVMAPSSTEDPPPNGQSSNRRHRPGGTWPRRWPNGADWLGLRGPRGLHGGEGPSGVGRLNHPSPATGVARRTARLRRIRATPADTRTARRRTDRQPKPARRRPGGQWYRTNWLEDRNEHCGATARPSRAGVDDARSAGTYVRVRAPDRDDADHRRRVRHQVGSGVRGPQPPRDGYVASYLTVAIAAVGLVMLLAHVASYRERGVLRRFAAAGRGGARIRDPDDARCMAGRGRAAAGRGGLRRHRCAARFAAASARSAQAVGLLMFFPRSCSARAVRRRR